MRNSVPEKMGGSVIINHTSHAYFKKLVSMMQITYTRCENLIIVIKAQVESMLFTSLQTRMILVYLFEMQLSKRHHHYYFRKFCSEPSLRFCEHTIFKS